MLRPLPFCHVASILFTLVTAASAQAQSVQWLTRLNDVAYAADWATAATFDPDGNALIAGYNDAGWAAWKLTPDGQVAWFWHYSGLARRDDEPRIAGLDADGNLYLVSGSSYGLTIVRLPPNGQDAVVRRHDGSANVTDALVTSTGDVFVAGWHRASIEQDSDVFVARFDRDGNSVWSATYDGPAGEDDWGAAIAIGPDGDVYVAGRVRYRAQDTHSLRYGGSVLRYTPAGDRVWASLTEMDPSAPEESVYSATLAVDSNGNAYVGGWKAVSAQAGSVIFKVSADGTPLWNAAPLDLLYTSSAGRSPRVLLDEARDAVYLAGDVQVANGDSDFLLRRYALDGSNPWTARYDGPAHARDNVLDAGVDAAGHVHLMGTSFATADNPDLIDVQFDADGQVAAVGRSDNGVSNYDRARVGTVAASGESLVVGGAFDQYLDSRAARLDPSGQVSWTTLLQSTVSSSDEFTAAAVDQTGAVFAVGTSDRRHSYESTFVLQRYSADGAAEWQQRLPIEYPEPQAVFVDPSGNAVVVARYIYSIQGLGVLHYGPDGTLQSARHYAGPQAASLNRAGMSMDALGNLFVCGTFEYRNAAGVSDYDAMVICVGPDGTARWSQALSGAQENRFFALATHASGTVTVTGMTRTSGVPNEIVTIRYAPNGFEQWRRIYSVPNGTNSDYPTAVNVAADGSAFVTLSHANSVGPLSVIVIKYAADGTQRWVREFVPPAGVTVLAGESRLDPTGNLVILCRLEVANHARDIFLLCYSPDGELLWQHRQTGPRNFSESPQLLEILATGDVLVSARISAADSFEFHDAMLLRLDSSGTPRWMSRQAQPADLASSITAIVPLPDGGFLTGGAAPQHFTDGVLIRYAPPAPACPGVDPCPADLNSDCQINLSDLALVLSGFGNALAEGFAPQNGDVDLDGDIDLQDLALVLSSWGSDCR